MDILDALEKFQTQLEADGRSAHTRDQYARHVRLFAHWLATEGRSAAVSAIDHETIARFLSSPQARTRSDGRAKRATSANQLRTSIRVFFGHLHQAGYVPKNPARLVRHAVCSAPPPRALTADEADRLMAALAEGKGQAAERDYALFHLLIASGIRVGSALALCIEDIDLDAGMVFVRKAKRDHPVQVILSAVIQEHLRVFIGGRVSGPLFSRHDGAPLSCRHMRRRFKMWLGRAGMRRQASVHDLRHTFATQLYEQTGDVLLVQQAMHHRSAVSTMVYAGVDEQRIRLAINA